MDSFQKPFNTYRSLKQACRLGLMIFGGFYLCTTPLWAQEAQPAEEEQRGQERFWDLSDEERLRDELPLRPTPFEIEQTRQTVHNAFQDFLQLWEEERYFELYELGKKQSRGFLSSEEFATRMVRLDWVPSGLDEKVPFDISFRYRTFIYVDATIQFRHKTNTSIEFQKRETFLLLWENGKWRFDLLQMLRSPFYTPAEQ